LMLLMSVKAHSHAGDKTVCYSEPSLSAALQADTHSHHQNLVRVQSQTEDLQIECLDKIVCPDSGPVALNLGKRASLREILSKNGQEIWALFRLFDHFHVLHSPDVARDPPKSFIDKVLTAKTSSVLIHLPTVVLTI